MILLLQNSIDEEVKLRDAQRLSTNRLLPDLSGLIRTSQLYRDAWCAPGTSRTASAP